MSEILEKFAPRQENMLLILHELQNRSERNYLDPDDLRKVAEYLNVTLATVYGVATYYSMLSTIPRGRHLIRVCASPICEIEGKQRILDALERLLGVGSGETTANGRFTVEHTECLGRCAAAPSVLVDEDIYGGVTPAKLESILERYE